MNRPETRTDAAGHECRCYDCVFDSGDGGTAQVEMWAHSQEHAEQRLQRFQAGAYVVSQVIVIGRKTERKDRDGRVWRRFLVRSTHPSSRWDVGLTLAATTREHASIQLCDLRQTGRIAGTTTSAGAFQ